MIAHCLALSFFLLVFIVFWMTDGEKPLTRLLCLIDILPPEQFLSSNL